MEGEKEQKKEYKPKKGKSSKTERCVKSLEKTKVKEKPNFKIMMKEIYAEEKMVQELGKENEQKGLVEENEVQERQTEENDEISVKCKIKTKKEIVSDQINKQELQSRNGQEVDLTSGEGRLGEKIEKNIYNKSTIKVKKEKMMNSDVQQQELENENGQKEAEAKETLLVLEHQEEHEEPTVSSTAVSSEVTSTHFNILVGDNDSLVGHEKISSINDLYIGLWVLVSYDSEIYVGQIMSVHPDAPVIGASARVKCLEKRYGDMNHKQPQDFEPKIHWILHSINNLYQCPVRVREVVRGRRKLWIY